MGHDHLRRLLMLLLAIAVAMRVVLFGEGGTAGAWSSSVLAWLVLSALAAAALRQLFLRARYGGGVPTAKWGIVLLLVVAVALAGLSPDETTIEAIGVTALLICIVALAALGLKDAVVNPSTDAEPPQR